MDFEYTVKRSKKRKKLTITVERDQSVIVHAPEGITEDEIHEIVMSKKRWVQEKISHPQKYREIPHAPGKEMVNGESILYLGQLYQIEFISSDSREIQLTQTLLIPECLGTESTKALKNWYLDRAKEKIIPRAKEYAKKFGVEAAEIKIVDNRYRWGSCTLKDNVTINWRLIKAPMYVIDYVVVHELAHLIEANHTPRFWNLVKSQLSNVEKAKD